MAHKIWAKTRPKTLTISKQLMAIGVFCVSAGGLIWIKDIFQNYSPRFSITQGAIDGYIFRKSSSLVIIPSITSSAGLSQVPTPKMW